MIFIFNAESFVREFTQLFPGRCLPCSLHWFGRDHGLTSESVPAPHDCIEVIALANEGGEIEAIGLENEFSVGADGWVKIAPYGEHLKERTVRDARLGGERREVFLQRLDRVAAQVMVDKFNSFWGKLKRFVQGVPIYKRHP